MRSILAARVEVETQLESDGLLWSNERKWIVYQPGERRDPSWYEDLELIGRKVQKTLAEVIAEKHDLPTLQVAALINERTAHRLVENWDRVFPNRTWSLDLDGLSSALLSLAFDEAGPLSPKSAVLRFLSDPVPFDGGPPEPGTERHVRPCDPHPARLRATSRGGHDQAHRSSCGR